MKMKLRDLGDLLIGGGTVYFIVRSIFSTVYPDQSYARDPFGFPLLNPSQEASIDIWILFIVGGILPFLIIGIGMSIKKISERMEKHGK